MNQMANSGNVSGMIQGPRSPSKKARAAALIRGQRRGSLREIAWRAQLGFTDLVMKLIAHRGWSAGRGENSLAAFARAARDGRISGVEFDVCRAADSDTLVVSHDPPRHVENALTLDAALSLLSPTDLELFVEVKETGLASRVIERLVASN